MPRGAVVTEAFSTVVMLATPGGSEGYSRLRMELPQERWAALAGRRELYLELAPERILPLRPELRHCLGLVFPDSEELPLGGELVPLRG